MSKQSAKECLSIAFSKESELSKQTEDVIFCSNRAPQLGVTIFDLCISVSLSVCRNSFYLGSLLRSQDDSRELRESLRESTKYKIEPELELSGNH